MIQLLSVAKNENTSQLVLTDENYELGHLFIEQIHVVTPVVGGPAAPIQIILPNDEFVIGKRVTEIFPGIKDFGLFDVFQRVWKTGKPEHHPIAHYEDKRIEGWRENYIYKLH